MDIEKELERLRHISQQCFEDFVELCSTKTFHKLKYNDEIWGQIRGNICVDFLLRQISKKIKNNPDILADKINQNNNNKNDTINIKFLFLDAVLEYICHFILQSHLICHPL